MPKFKTNLSMLRVRNQFRAKGRRRDNLFRRIKNTEEIIATGFKEVKRKNKETGQYDNVRIKLTPSQITDHRARLQNLKAESVVAENQMKNVRFKYSSASKINFKAASELKDTNKKKIQFEKVNQVQSLLKKADKDELLNLQTLTKGKKDEEVKAFKREALKVARKYRNGKAPISNIIKLGVEVISESFNNWDPKKTSHPVFTNLTLSNYQTRGTQNDKK